MTDKAGLRKGIKEAKRAAGKQQLADESRRLCEALMANRHVADAQTVMAFYPLADEPDIVPLLDALISRGKRVVLPHVEGKLLSLRDYEGRDHMVEGRYHILEPVTPSAIAPAEIDVVLVPGVAFGRSGERLGRGGGFYDRFLPTAPQARKIGVGFSCQMVDSLPMEAHDQRMDEVIRI